MAVLDSVARAAGAFAVTNVDDLLVLALYLGRAAGDRRGAARVVVGQYLGFAAITAVSVAGAFGAQLLPEQVIPYLGLVPLLLGVRAAWTAWRERGRKRGEPGGPSDRAPGVFEVAGVTLANGGDNIGVYIPVFAVSGASGLAIYAVTFLVLVGVWCVAGWFCATRSIVARVLSCWGHILLPVVLIAIGLTILVQGGAFGL